MNRLGIPPTMWPGRLDDDDDKEESLPQQVMRKLAHADRMLGEGKDVRSTGSSKKPPPPAQTTR
jgi:hypothetical protein